ncbi:hypothetical protein ACH4SP_14460 [Streptomyces sp. NPDC021093]|uniref:hypothetical protein n=1 Tax=Streptomyces sp. NPDC021093 TaxID=3365112 RepID=UPI00379B7E19
MIDAAPDLSRPAPLGERIIGVVTLVGLYAGLVVALESDLPRWAGICVYLAALTLLFGWSGHHEVAVRRRPHTKPEMAVRFCGVVSLSLPGAGLVFDNGPGTLTGHLVAAAAPTLAAAVYLVLRWRR